jgi:hypothetical protein
VSEEETADGPFLKTRLYVKNLDLGLSYDAEVVTSPADRPESGFPSSVTVIAVPLASTHICGDKLVRCQTIPALIPPMTTTENGRYIADAGTGGRRSLFALSPQDVGDIAIAYTASNNSSLAVICDDQVVHAAP